MKKRTFGPLRFILFAAIPVLLLVTVVTIFAETAGAGGGAAVAGGSGSPVQAGSPAPGANFAGTLQPDSGSWQPGELEIKAMRQAYPSRITDAQLRGGEWALQMDGIWYYWSQGRLLPDNLRADWEQYAAIRFYSYEMGPFEVREIPEEQAARLRSNNPASQVDNSVRFNGFLDALYQVDSLQSAERTMVNVKILGWGTRVHPMLVEPIRRINRRLGMLMKSDPEMLEFVRGIASAHGYNWRNIANTVRRSYHSYGVSVDLLPADYNRQAVYWLWAAESGIDEWWAIPEHGRWLFSEAFVQVFEEEGFIWGAKWLMYDNIHFEYRPEVILMSKLREQF